MTDQATSVTPRPAKRHDIPAIAAMAAEFHAFLASKNGSDPAFDVERAAAALDRSGFGPRPLFSALIAEAGHDPVGYAIYNIGFWGDSFQARLLLTDLFVREASRGRGVARQLMHRLADVGRTEGCDRVIWTVWSRNDEAMRFYAGLGAVLLEDERLMKWPI